MNLPPQLGGESPPNLPPGILMGVLVTYLTCPIYFFFFNTYRGGNVGGAL